MSAYESAKECSIRSVRNGRKGMHNLSLAEIVRMWSSECNLDRDDSRRLLEYLEDLTRRST